MVVLGSSGCLIVDRRFELAQGWRLQGDLASAIELLEQTLEECPGWPVLHFTLGEWLMEAGETGRAVTAFRDYLSLDERDEMGAIIKLSLLGVSPQPPCLPERYVESLFDQYAPRFDKALVERLSYTVPMALRSAVDAFRPPQGPTERILDLGCGTGLAGETFFARACWLEGVDLSAGMLAEVENKKIFNRLRQGDAVSSLADPSAGQAQPYDLVVAADVLVYIGALEDLMAAVARNLAKNGLFAFSVQALADGDYLLGGDHRYAHSRAYIDRSLSAAGMRIESCEQRVIRMDGGREIHGLIVVASRQASDEAAFDAALLPRARRRDRSGLPT